jgi:hypothetical protein
VNTLQATLDDQTTALSEEADELRRERDDSVHRLEAADAERWLLEERVAFLETLVSKYEHQRRRCTCGGGTAETAVDEDAAMERLRTSLARISEIADCLVLEQE